MGRTGPLLYCVGVTSRGRGRRGRGALVRLALEGEWRDPTVECVAVFTLHSERTPEIIRSVRIENK